MVLQNANLLKNIRDMYSAKGTRDGHKLFFRILFDEEAVITYPRDNMFVFLMESGQPTRLFV